MFKVWDSRDNYFHSMFFGGSLNELWRESGHGGWATAFALIVILVWHCYKRFPFIFSSSNLTPSDSGARIHPQLKMLEIVSDADLKFLIENLDQKHHDNEKWEHVIDKRNTVLSYNAKCCKPKMILGFHCGMHSKGEAPLFASARRHGISCTTFEYPSGPDGPLKYLSETVFENCSPEMLRDFYMDNDYRKKWDKTLVDHEQLQVDRTNGVEIGRTIKKFPLLTPREYILAWRLWEGKDRTFYCFIKECEHPSTPRQKKYVRVQFFRSGWRIRKVPGRNACEIKMFHQEDAGLNVKMAKLAFAKGIWSYVCNMDNALLKYSAVSHPHSAVTAVTLIQKVPPALDTMEGITSSATAFRRQITNEPKEKKFIRRPSRKFLANGLLFVGGAICLSRGHSSLGAKVAMAYILAKLSKRGTASDQSRES